MVLPQDPSTDPIPLADVIQAEALKISSIGNIGMYIGIIGGLVYDRARRPSSLALASPLLLSSPPARPCHTCHRNQQILVIIRNRAQSPE